MHAEIGSGALREALRLARGATGRSSTLTALADILLTARDDALVLRATDLEAGMAIHVPARIKQTGSVLVRPDDLAPLLDRRAGAPVTIERASGAACAITAGTVRALVPLRPVAGFPRFPTDATAPALALDAANARRALAATLPATGDGYDAEGRRLSAPYRPPAAVLLEGDATTVTLAATTNTLYARSSVPRHDRGGAALSCVLPVRALALLSRALARADGPVRVERDAGGTVCRLAIGSVAVLTRPLRAAFPSVGSALTDAATLRVTLDRRPLEVAAAVAGARRLRSMTCAFESTGLTLGGREGPAVAVACGGPATTLRLAVSGRHVVAVLRALQGVDRLVVEYVAGRRLLRVTTPDDPDRVVLLAASTVTSRDAGDEGEA